MRWLYVLLTACLIVLPTQGLAAQIGNNTGNLPGTAPAVDDADNLNDINNLKNYYQVWRWENGETTDTMETGEGCAPGDHSFPLRLGGENATQISIYYRETGTSSQLFVWDCIEVVGQTGLIGAAGVAPVDSADKDEHFCVELTATVGAAEVTVDGVAGGVQWLSISRPGGFHTLVFEVQACTACDNVLLVTFSQDSQQYP